MKKQLVPITILLATGLLLPGCFKTNKNSSSVPGIDSSTDIVEQEYTITFNFCNGNPDDNIRKTGKEGDTITPPKGKNYGGKSFAGWSTKYSSSTKCGTLTDIVTGNITIGTENKVYYAAYQSAPEHTDEEVDAYMADLKTKSQNRHLYYHYHH